MLQARRCDRIIAQIRAPALLCVEARKSHHVNHSVAREFLDILYILDGCLFRHFVRDNLYERVYNRRGDEVNRHFIDFFR